MRELQCAMLEWRRDSEARRAVYCWRGHLYTYVGQRVQCKQTHVNTIVYLNTIQQKKSALILARSCLYDSETWYYRDK